MVNNHTVPNFVISLPKETTGNITIANGEWANLSEDSQYNDADDVKLSVNLLGGEVTFSFHFTSTYSDFWEDYKFTAALTSEQIAEKVVNTFYFTVDTSDMSGFDVYVEFYADGTGRFFTADIQRNWNTGEVSFTNIANVITFNWELNADNDVVLSNLVGTMSVEYSYYDWDTEETINGVSNVTFGTTVDVEPLLFSEIKFSYSNEYTSEGTATAYTVSE